MTKYCVLEDGKICDECGKCSVCDLDPNKICDNCMKCLKTDADYRAIEIDEVFESEDAPGYQEEEMARIWREPLEEAPGEDEKG